MQIIRSVPYLLHNLGPAAHEICLAQRTMILDNFEYVRFSDCFARFLIEMSNSSCWADGTVVRLAILQSQPLFRTKS